MTRGEDPPNGEELLNLALDRGRELETQLASVRIRFELTNPVAQSLSDAVDAMLGLVWAYRRRHAGRKDAASLERREQKSTTSGNASAKPVLPSSRQPSEQSGLRSDRNPGHVRFARVLCASGAPVGPRNSRIQSEQPELIWLWEPFFALAWDLGAA
jgi:hypothetical protein